MALALPSFLTVVVQSSGVRQCDSLTHVSLAAGSYTLDHEAAHRRIM